MAHATVSTPIAVGTGNRRARQAATILAWTGIVILAIGFVFKYVLFYYRHYDAASFDPYWPRRGWLFLHINGGTLALLMGLCQFWTGLRRKSMMNWIYTWHNPRVDANAESIASEMGDIFLRGVMSNKSRREK